ncbi:hypothetical protein ACW2Q0_16905 [Nocardia sp. R16R-3T]
MTARKGANPALMFLLELGALAGAAFWGFTFDVNSIDRLFAAESERSRVVGPAELVAVR